MNESFVKNRVSNQLLNLDWCIEGKARNVFLEGECKTEEQKRKLKGKRPDYILYEQDSITPLGIIEAKKPKGNLDKALTQGLQYAKEIEAKIVFATDGYIVKAIDIDNNPLTIDGEILKDFVSEKILKKFTELPNLKTEKNILKNRNELISIFNKASKYLRPDGIDAGIDAIYEFCSILFIKIKSESNEIEDYYSWDNLVKNTGNNLYEHYKKTLDYFREKYSGIFREIQIKKPSTLEKIVESIKDLNISNTDIDIKGSAYEHFLKRYSSQNKSALGQYFTPRHIIEMMCILLDPSIKEKIYDPFCGTGGMLIECYRYIRKNITEKTEIEKLNKGVLFGNDIALAASQLAKMNMVLLGDGHTNIQWLDSLDNPISDKYDCVITNIPFNLDSTETGKLHYKTSETNANNICLRHCIQAVKKGGRACIIIPENICYDNQYTSIRKFLVESGKINAVIRLPRETFKTYTTARTCILWITEIKKSKTEKFAYAEIGKDGYSEGSWREPILENDIPKVLEYKDKLEEKFKNKNLTLNYEFITKRNTADIKIPSREGYWLLKELLEIKTEKLKLEENKTYQEPRLSSKDNTITSKGKGRLGKNIKTAKKIIIEPDDLVIATLHTQSGNGLFAISDDYYIATSQIVAKIKENIVNKPYLVLMLRKILPALSKSDLTGRETYKPEEILHLKIPKQPKNFDTDLKKIKLLEEEIEIRKKKIEDYKK